MKKLLESFFTSKRTELENLQANLKSDHVNKVNTFLLNERANNRLIQQMSNEILQEDYLLLKANSLMTMAMETKFRELYKAYDGHRGVTFSEENIVHQNYDMDDHNDMVLRPEEMANGDIDDIEMDCDDNNAPPLFTIPTGPKARRALHPELSNGPTSALDVTQVIERHDMMEDDVQPLSGPNATFLLSAKPTRPGVTFGQNKKVSVVSRVLKDTNPNIAKEFGSAKGNLYQFWYQEEQVKFFCSMQFFRIGMPKPFRNGATATVIKEKENKRIVPIHARKSPHRPASSPSNALKKSKFRFSYKKQCNP